MFPTFACCVFQLSGTVDTSERCICCVSKHVLVDKRDSGKSGCFHSLFHDVSIITTLSYIVCHEFRKTSNDFFLRARMWPVSTRLCQKFRFVSAFYNPFSLERVSQISFVSFKDVTEDFEHITRRASNLISQNLLRRLAPLLETFSFVKFEVSDNRGIENEHVDQLIQQICSECDKVSSS